MGSLARLTFIVALAILVSGCGTGATTAPSAPSAALASPGAVSVLPTASPAPPSASASETAAASSDTLTDVDDGATAGATGWLSGEPDPALTPGALNSAVTQATIGTTICVSGWTATIRPPSSYTTSLKIQQIPLYGYADTSTAAYEEDHLISLELGGAPKDPHNLWPEPYVATLPDGRNVGARVKDALETLLKKEVCAGAVTLSAAQAEIGIHWVHAYYGIPLAASAASGMP